MNLKDPKIKLCIYILGDHIIYIHHNSAIKKDAKLRLQLIRQDNDGLLEIPDIVGEANDFVVKKDLIKFKVDMNDPSAGNYNVILNVFVHDEDVCGMSFDQLSQSAIRIKVFIQQY